MSEGAGEKTICREMEIMALKACDDKLYQEVIKAVKEGKEVTDYPKGHEMTPFFGVWGELGIEETRAGSLVTVGSRLLVPEASRQKVLENLHRTHPGKSTMIANARHLYYWPGLRIQCVEMCESCDTCSLHARSRMASAPQIQEDISALVPMEVIGLDLHSHRGRTYISAQDHCSGFRWCERIKNQSSQSVIQFVTKLMRLYGKITVVRADNGPCFRGPFQEYLEELGVAFKPSSPYNPVSNSCAESSVRLNKILQQKTDCSDEKLQDFMLWSNCLVRPDGSGSPAEVFFRRHMNVPGILRASGGDINYQRLQNLREESVAQRRNKNTTRHYRASFRPGDVVLLQNVATKKWDEKGTIIKSRDCTLPEASRSYLVDVGQDQLKLRNRSHIRLSCRRVQAAGSCREQSAGSCREQSGETGGEVHQLGARRKKVRFFDELVECYSTAPDNRKFP